LPVGFVGEHNNVLLSSNAFLLHSLIVSARRLFFFLPRLTWLAKADGFLTLSALLGFKGLSLDKVRCPLQLISAGKEEVEWDKRG
jgi:hypothetical protein